MADTVPAASVTPSTNSVPPQNRLLNSDVILLETVHFDTTATDQKNWSPGIKVRIVELRVVNDDVAQAASTNTTAINVDIEDGAGAKTHDVATKAAGTAIAADAMATLTLSTTEADLVMENTEILRVDSTIAGTQGSYSVVVKYKLLEVSDYAGDWPATPA